MQQKVKTLEYIKSHQEAPTAPQLIAFGLLSKLPHNRDSKRDKGVFEELECRCVNSCFAHAQLPTHSNTQICPLGALFGYPLLAFGRLEFGLSVNPQATAPNTRICHRIKVLSECI